MLLRAFAKINLDLRVLHRRSDGYHEVRTVLQTIDWCDEIRMEPASRLDFVVQGGVPADESNLVIRAVREFERETNSPASVRIELTKNIPAGAGLGGGSSDAAVTLLGLQKVLGRNLSDAGQLRCLQRLGSDVPFFAVGGRALGTGRGENVAPLEDDAEDRNTGLVVVNPGIAVSTEEAYSWLTINGKSNSIEGFGDQFVAGNDFERVVFARHPVLADIKRELSGLGAVRASLSGSGSAVFGIFRTREQAARAASSLRGSVAACVTRPVQRSEYLSRVFGG